jgi:anaerobic selenocysteine-containing dehydrogenase
MTAMAAATPEATTRPSVCPLDCPDTCSLTVHVRDDVVTKVGGSRSNPVTAGKICAKVARGLPELVHGPDRLTVPLRRSGPRGQGAFEPVSWSSAIDEIYDRYSQIIAEHGAEAILPFNYSGSLGLLASGGMSTRFFNRLGASELDSAPLCAGTSGAAYGSLFGEVPGIVQDELADSKLIVIWGHNVTTSGLHLTRIIRRATARGAKLVVVDPKRTRIAEDAHLHLGLRPGTDVVLAYAVAAELERQDALAWDFIRENAVGADAYLERARMFTIERAAEICGLNPADIRLFADFWRDFRPAGMNVGIGPERNANGGAGIRAAYALPVLTGNFGVRGAGVCAEYEGFFPARWDALNRPDFAPDGGRRLSILDVPDHILDPTLAPPIKSVFIFNHNPIAVHPRQRHLQRALASDDLFIVGCDISMTDSMAVADIVLPACSHLEYGDVYTSYGHPYLQRSERVIAPVGEALPNSEIFRRLARRFGFEDEAFRQSDAEILEEAIDPRSLGAGRRSVMELGVEESVDCAPVGTPTLFRGSMPATPSGKAELYSEALQEECGAGLPAYRALERRHPFVLVSPASDKRTNSMFGGTSTSGAPTLIEMNPQDAAARGLETSQRVRVWNEQGDVELTLAVSDAIRPGTLYTEKGTWLRSSANGQTINALIPGDKADLAGGACYYDTQVEIEAAAAA